MDEVKICVVAVDVDFVPYAERVCVQLRAAGMECKLFGGGGGDETLEEIYKHVRPTHDYVLIVGFMEAQQGTVMVRSDKDMVFPRSMRVDEFILSVSNIANV